jgi:hypothetical protein
MLKTILNAVIAILLCFASGSCTKKIASIPPVSPKYALEFKLTASGTPVEINQTIANAPTRYYVQTLRFYAGFPRLVKTDGTEVPLANVVIVKFDTGIPDNLVCAHTFNFYIPTGSYKSIRFGIGMPDKIKDTVTHYHYGALDPLNSDYGLLWTMSATGKNNTFRNIGMAIMADTSKAQNQTPSRFLSFHILEDDTTLNLYKELEIADNFTVGNGDLHTINLNLDINNVFFNASNPIDLRHSGSTDMINGDDKGIALGIKINNNFYNSISKP